MAELLSSENININHMSSGALEKKNVSARCIDILRETVHWFAEIGVSLPINIFKTKNTAFTTATHICHLVREVLIRHV
jgi:hypothetical protein